MMDDHHSRLGAQLVLHGGELRRHLVGHVVEEVAGGHGLRNVTVAVAPEELDR